MTDNNAFERFVADHLADDGSGSAQAERLAALIHDRTGRRRQRPRWLALITEPPMRTNDQLMVGSPSIRVAMIMVATVMLAVALAAVGAGAHRLLTSNAEIVVALDGSGDHRTINEALAAASDGDRILLRPGTYEEALDIDKSVRLRGDGGRAAVVIAFPPDGPEIAVTRGSPKDFENPPVTFTLPVGIRLGADDIDLSGLTISSASGAAAVAVISGSAELDDVAITLDAADAEPTGDPALDARLGLVVAGGASADVGGSTFAADVEVLESGSVTVEQSVLNGGGIWGNPDSTVLVQDNVLTDASIGSDGALAEIDGNRLLRGYIGVGGDGRYTVTDNHVDQLRYDVGTGIAITVWNAGEVKISGNRVTDSDTGIKVIFFGGTALIDGNTLESVRTGISVGGNKTTVSNNVIESADIIGLEVFNAGPTLTDNSITGGGTGLHLATTDAATASGNTICGNRINVRVVSGELPNLDGNDICEDGTD